MSKYIGFRESSGLSKAALLGYDDIHGCCLRALSRSRRVCVSDPYDLYSRRSLDDVMSFLQPIREQNVIEFLVEIPYDQKITHELRWRGCTVQRAH